MWRWSDLAGPPLTSVNVVIECKLQVQYVLFSEGRNILCQNKNTSNDKFVQERLVGLNNYNFASSSNIIK